MNNFLELFHPIILEWFKNNLGQPTEIQKKVWPLISQNKHLFITAPTGSGKTLTAFLWAINKLFLDRENFGNTHILYISPLKALNNDIQKNLLKPVKEIKELFLLKGESFRDINILTRSGDTPSYERQRMLKNPPEILITTPESLNILLTYERGRNILSGLSTVILDEIHALHGTKRGTHLITAVERLTLLSGEFQRIALSATVNPLKTAAEFVAGYIKSGSAPEYVYQKREITILQSSMKKKVAITVNFPEGANENIVDGSRLREIVREIKEIIRKNRSTLIFTNSRRTCEKIARFINENEEELLAYSHHSSLSKELRYEVEQKLKKGGLKAIVATSSLELGIDMGKLDHVILLQSPFSIASAIQKVGRAGHNVGDVSIGSLYPTHGQDFIESAVIARALMDGDLESIKPVNVPLDMLAQIILSMTATKVWDIDELYAFLKTSYPYRELKKEHYQLVISMLAGKYMDSRINELKPRVIIDKIDHTITAGKSARQLLFLSGGTITNRGYFTLRLADSKAVIGELDEEFVWERKIGETFVLGHQLWKITAITQSDVEVIPEENNLNIIPFWKADEVTRGFHLSQKIGNFLQEAQENLENKDYKSLLITDYYMSDTAADELINFLKLQRSLTNVPFPSRHHILIEHYNPPNKYYDNCQVIIHTLWGNAVNRPFAFALASAWEEKYNYPLQFNLNNNAILFVLPHDFNIKMFLSMINPDQLEILIRKKLENSGYFGAIFRENAQRAMLLPGRSFTGRVPLWFNRVRSKKLLESVMDYSDFPILLETWRTCIQDDFDLDTLKMLLTEIETGEIQFTEIYTTNPTVFAKGLVWKQTDKLMYEDDTLSFNRTSNLTDEIIKEFVEVSALRPKIDNKIIINFDKKIKQLAPGYSPESSQELLELVKERLLIPEYEWQAIDKAIQRDHEETIDNMIQSIADRLVFLTLPGAKVRSVIAVENIARLLECFKIALDQLDIQSCIKVSNEVNNKVHENIFKILKKRKKDEFNEEYFLNDFLLQWLSFYGPLSKDHLLNVFGFQSQDLDKILLELKELNLIIIDKICEENQSEEICLIKNLEILLRLNRKSFKEEFKPLDISHLPLLLANQQGLINKGDNQKNLEKILEIFFGYAAPAQAWEELILPTRLSPYHTMWLDNIFIKNDFIWRGNSNKKVSLFFRDDIDLFFKSNQSIQKKDIIITKLFNESGARYDFFTLVHKSGLTSEEAAKKLWELTWKGLITNDSFETLRKGILNKFETEKIERKHKNISRTGFNRWKSTRPMTGSWYLLPVINEADPVEEQEIIKARINILLKRYGVLFREILINELELLQWRYIFKTLRIMEFSGEVISGHFIKSIPGIQFTTFEIRRKLAEDLGEDEIYWINAVDPASLCGSGIRQLTNELPSRLISNYIVYHGVKPVIILNKQGKNLEIRVGENNKELLRYLQIFKDLLSRQFNPLKKIVVEQINKQAVQDSSYIKVFKEFGFKLNYRRLELWREF